MIDWLPFRFSLNGKRGRRSDAAGVLARAKSLAARAVAVPGLRESEAAFHRELERARRYERPLSVVVLSIDEGPPQRPEPAGSRTDARTTIRLETRIPYLATLLAGSILTRVLRQSDLIAYAAADDRFVILLPEAEKADADAAVVRLAHVLRDRMRVGVRAGTAAFPDDGLTTSKLVESATDAWRRQQARRETVMMPDVAAIGSPVPRDRHVDGRKRHREAAR